MSYSIDGGFDSCEDGFGSLDIENGISDKNSSVKGDVALWKAVITQALMDAGSNSKKMEMRKAKSEAIAWLSGVEEDFDIVCYYAQMSPNYVRVKAKEAIARGCTWREVNPNSFTKNRKKKIAKKTKKYQVDKVRINVADKYNEDDVPKYNDNIKLLDLSKIG